MRYIDRLKNLDSGKRLPTELPKLPKPPYGSFCSSHEAHFQKTATPAPKVGAGDTAASFDREHFEERAAIYEYDAGLPRHEAERLAYQEIAKWQTQSAWQTS
jgi:hypothetical protein